MFRITQLKKIDAATLGVIWDDGLESRFDVGTLREECTCAQCRDEWTGEKLPQQNSSLQKLPGALPQAVRPVTIESVGQYALKIVWSDGHKAGLYTFEQLRKWGETKVD